jgi:hypothetical protein
MIKSRTQFRVRPRYRKTAVTARGLYSVENAISPLFYFFLTKQKNLPPHGPSTSTPTPPSVNLQPANNWSSHQMTGGPAKGMPITVRVLYSVLDGLRPPIAAKHDPSPTAPPHTPVGWDAPSSTPLSPLSLASINRKRCPPRCQNPSDIR